MIPITTFNKINRLARILEEIYDKKHIAPYQVIETLFAIEVDWSGLM